MDRAARSPADHRPRAREEARRVHEHRPAQALRVVRQEGGGENASLRAGVLRGGPTTHALCTLQASGARLYRNMFAPSALEAHPSHNLANHHMPARHLFQTGRGECNRL